MAPWYWPTCLLAGCLAVQVAVPRAEGSARFQASTGRLPLGSFDRWALGTVAVLTGLRGAFGTRSPLEGDLLGRAG